MTKKVLEPLSARELSLTDPDDSEIEKVKKYSIPGSTQGDLCVCSGTSTGETGDFLQMVFFKNVQGENQTIAVADVLQSPYFKSIGESLNAPVDWTHNAAIPAWHGPSGSEAWNTLRAVSVIYRNGSMGMEIILPHASDIASYKGLGVDSCTGGQKASPAAAVPKASSDDREPADRDGDWLLYRGLSVSGFGRGSRLVQHGLPLRARTLAFAAANVHWQRGQIRRTEISRAAGESVIATAPTCFFPGAPLSCLVLWQIGSTAVKSVIASECRQQPDIKHLLTNDEIYVQVNFDFNDFTSRTGSFDLWVKVID